MDYIFKEWQEKLAEFEKNVEKDLEEIRKCKAEMQQMKLETISRQQRGQYIYDPERIILSAPEIVIGHCDSDGNVYQNGASTIVIHGTSVSMHGVGETGQVEMRAPSIRQIAEDPGTDGNEHVVGSISEVVSQARNIIIQSNNCEGTFPIGPVGAPGGSGVRIHADEVLDMSASTSSERLSKSIDDLVKVLESQKTALKKDADGHKSSFDQLNSDITKLLDKKETLIKDDDQVCSTYSDVEDLNEQIEDIAQLLTNEVYSYSSVLSQLAETNRRIKSLKEQKDKIKKGDDFKKKFTGAQVMVTGERISLTSADGDGNLRDNEGSGVSIIANETTIKAIEHDYSLKKEGKVSINAKTVEVSTANTADEKYDDKGQLTQGTYAAEGDVIIKSKTIDMQTVDYEFKDNKLTEKALTKEGKISLRAEQMDLSATDTEGKATGSIDVNSKAITVRSMDVDKEKRTDTELAAGSTMTLVSEKMFIGAKSKKVKSKKIQAVTEEMGLFADKTFEAQQGEKKAVVQLADGKAAVSGSETQVYGKTTINAATEIKAELKAPKATIDSIEAKSAFKSPNISDGMAAGGGGGGGSLSAKLSEEDAPEKK